MKKNKNKLEAEIQAGSLSQDLDLEEGDLQTQQEMLSQATVTDEDVDSAVEAWRDNPPEEGYENLLEAEVVEE